MGRSDEPARRLVLPWAPLGLVVVVIPLQRGALGDEPLASPLLAAVVVLVPPVGAGELVVAAPGTLDPAPPSSPCNPPWGVGRALALATLPSRRAAVPRAVLTALKPVMMTGVVGAALLVLILKARLPRAALPLRMAWTSPSPALLQVLGVRLVPLA